MTNDDKGGVGGDEKVSNDHKLVGGMGGQNSCFCDHEIIEWPR